MSGRKGTAGVIRAYCVLGLAVESWEDGTKIQEFLESRGQWLVLTACHWVRSSKVTEVMVTQKSQALSLMSVNIEVRESV